MASTKDFVSYVMEQILGTGSIRHIKMMGEYLVYVNDRPVFLICDNTAFIKILPETTAILGSEARQDYPYKGAKLHYVVDVDDREIMSELAKTLARVISLPKSKKK